MIRRVRFPPETRPAIRAALRLAPGFRRRVRQNPGLAAAAALELAAHRPQGHLFLTPELLCGSSRRLARYLGLRRAGVRVLSRIPARSCSPIALEIALRLLRQPDPPKWLFHLPSLPEGVLELLDVVPRLRVTWGFLLEVSQLSADESVEVAWIVDQLWVDPDAPPSPISSLKSLERLRDAMVERERRRLLRHIPLPPPPENLRRRGVLRLVSGERLGLRALLNWQDVDDHGHLQENCIPDDLTLAAALVNGESVLFEGTVRGGLLSIEVKRTDAGFELAQVRGWNNEPAPSWVPPMLVAWLEAQPAG